MSSRTLLPIFCVILLFLSYAGYSQPASKAKSKVKYNYLLYLPNDYAATKASYPLIIYLHGGSQRGNDLMKLKTYGLPQQVDKGKDFQFIIASPQCPDGKFWSTDNWFEPLYDELTTKYSIDPKRVYLTGISIGGYGTWQTAVAYPDKFAAIVPLCGGCDDSTQVCTIKHIPIWTFHGTADNVIPINETEQLVKRLEQCGGRVKFTRLEKEGHGIQYLYEEKSIYDWLLQQHK
ncbi:prolyl oligopeptidase family serine peptidase [Spirosoma aureum]|uniref:Prolyl oligopeptidase family serine peptidase n=1 Tax=Spirosoma aureum TaxID=2692134 RepID=A0A6G9AXB6_9BACT|nr:prolyl oligopeptidase family serine peptidase [Spirosoma aureum]QIP17131.1 prolyl oligopeptidase family serine peptidase [Spirosoma aureum]